MLFSKHIRPDRTTSGDGAMRRTLPPIDLAAPADTLTATFAAG